MKEQQKLSLKKVLIERLKKLSNGQFVFFICTLLAFFLALLSPDIRGRFLELVGQLCAKTFW